MRLWWAAFCVLESVECGDPNLFGDPPLSTNETEFLHPDPTAEWKSEVIRLKE